MWPARYFNPRYWAERFWAKVGAEPVPVTAVPPLSRSFTPDAERRTWTPDAEARTWTPDAERREWEAV